MSYSIAPLARSDLREILNYIRRDNPYAAKRIRSAVTDAARRLAVHPGIGHTNTEFTRLPLRFLTVRGGLTLAYRERPNGVEIVRVFGPGRDIAALL